jgi:hypothetical protein
MKCVEQLDGTIVRVSDSDAEMMVAGVCKYVSKTAYKMQERKQCSYPGCRQPATMARLKNKDLCAFCNTQMDRNHV